MSGDTTFQPSLYGQIVTIGWIGDHLGDGGDFAMLMAYSPGDGAAGPDASQPALREIVAARRMREGTMVEDPIVHGAPVLAVLDGINVTVRGFPSIDMARPTSPEWADIARQRGQIFFALTTKTWPEAPRPAKRQPTDSSRRTTPSAALCRCCCPWPDTETHEGAPVPTGDAVPGLCPR